MCLPVTGIELPGRLYFIMDFSRDGKRLAVGSNAGVLTIHDVDSGEVLRRFAGHKRIRDLAFSPDEKQLWAIGAAGLGIVWDVETAQPLLRLEGGCVRWSSDGQRIFVRSSPEHAEILTVNKP